MFRPQPLDHQPFQRHVEHLHALGPRAVAEAFAEIIHCGAEPATVRDVLGEFSPLTPAMVRAAGGDRFPPRPVRRVG